MPAFADLKIPDLKMQKFIFPGWSKDTTVGDLVRILVAVNAEKLDIKSNTDDEVWARLVKVFKKQQAISPEQMRLDATIFKDLGID